MVRVQEVTTDGTVYKDCAQRLITDEVCEKAPDALVCFCKDDLCNLATDSGARLTVLIPLLIYWFL